MKRILVGMSIFLALAVQATQERNPFDAMIETCQAPHMQELFSPLAQSTADVERIIDTIVTGVNRPEYFEQCQALLKDLNDIIEHAPHELQKRVIEALWPKNIEKRDLRFIVQLFKNALVGASKHRFDFHLASQFCNALFIASAHENELLTVQANLYRETYELLSGLKWFPLILTGVVVLDAQKAQAAFGMQAPVNMILAIEYLAVTASSLGGAADVQVDKTDILKLLSTTVIVLEERLEQ